MINSTGHQGTVGSTQLRFIQRMVTHLLIVYNLHIFRDQSNIYTHKERLCMQLSIGERKKSITIVLAPWKLYFLKVLRFPRSFH